jgi:hypothetical protein
MGTPSGAGTPRFTTYTTAAEYNAAYPDAPLPARLHFLRSYTCAGAGLKDDLTASEKKHTLDFLPGGVPETEQPDRIGTVVATRWGHGPHPGHDLHRRHSTVRCQTASSKSLTASDETDQLWSRSYEQPGPRAHDLPSAETGEALRQPTVPNAWRHGRTRRNAAGRRGP